MHQNEEGLAAAKRAVELAADSWWAASILAEALVRAGQHDSAIDAAERAVDLGDEGVWQPFVTLANVLGQAGRFTEARSAWDDATKMNSRLSLAYLDRGEGYAHRNKRIG